MTTETQNALTRDASSQDRCDSSDIDTDEELLLPFVELEGLSDLTHKWLTRVSTEMFVENDPNVPIGVS